MNTWNILWVVRLFNEPSFCDMPCQKITGCESMYSRIKGVPLWQEHKWLRYRTGSSQIMLKQGTSGLSSMEDCLFAKSYLKARHSQFWLLVCRKFGTWVITSGCQKVCGLKFNKTHHTERDGKEKGIFQDKRRCNQEFWDQMNRAGFHSRNSQLVYQSQA